MRYAIIAAGEGSRLVAEGVRESKPLVKVMGVPLIDRLLRIFMSHDATDIVVICNEHMRDVQDHLSLLQRNGLDGQMIPLRYKVKNTQSSMHSLYELSDWLEGEPFCLTTVDTVFREDDFSRYVRLFNDLVQHDLADGLMGVTDYIDDEKPLYVGVDVENRVTGFFDDPHDCKYISGGVYGLTPRSLDTLRACVMRGEHRMRNFQRALVADGLRIDACPFSKVLDIDHTSDLVAAELFLKA